MVWFSVILARLSIKTIVFLHHFVLNSQFLFAISIFKAEIPKIQFISAWLLSWIKRRFALLFNHFNSQFVTSNSQLPFSSSEILHNKRDYTEISLKSWWLQESEWMRPTRIFQFVLLPTRADVFRLRVTESCATHDEILKFGNFCTYPRPLLKGILTLKA